VLKREGRGDRCLVRLPRLLGLLRLGQGSSGWSACLRICTLHSALCMLETRGEHSSWEALAACTRDFLAARSQAIEALLGYWTSRPEAGLAHVVACFIPAFHF
jgi:hypothetical protein